MLHLVGFFCMNYTMRHGSTNIKCTREYMSTHFVRASSWFFNKINSATGFSYFEKDYSIHLKPATSYNAHSAVPVRQV